MVHVRLAGKPIVSLLTCTWNQELELDIQGPCATFPSLLRRLANQTLRYTSNKSYNIVGLNLFVYGIGGWISHQVASLKPFRRNEVWWQQVSFVKVRLCKRRQVFTCANVKSISNPTASRFSPFSSTLQNICWLRSKCWGTSSCDLREDVLKRCAVPLLGALREFAE